MQQAVISTGGKQYIVSPGTSLKIEKIKGDFKAGDTITFDQVLMVDDGQVITLGSPTVPGKKVTATLVKAARARKVIVMHYKAKANERKKAGHRQPYFEVKIEAIA